MTELCNGIYTTSSEELSALALEAQRRGISYGRLVANTTPYEQRKIIRDHYKKKAKRRIQRKEEILWMNFQPAGQLSLYDEGEAET